jgi:predicted double-glycine peptidase
MQLQKLKARKQRRNYTCGPAALRTIFYFYGYSASEQDLIDEGEIGEEGTSHSTMRFLARKHGFSFYSKTKASIKDIEGWLDRKIPVLVDYQAYGPFNGNSGHYAVAIGLDAEWIELADPANYTEGDGKKFTENRKIKRSEFLQRWFDTGETQVYKWMAIIKKK